MIGIDEHKGTPGKSGRGPGILLLVTLVVVAALLRSAGLVHFDLWLDEFWTILQVSELSHWDQVIISLHHDNNHILNSLWLYVLGPLENPVLYRIVSFGCSLATVMLAASLSIPLALFLAFSYPFVLYSTEARGYSMLLLAVVISVVALEKLTGRKRGLVLFASSLFGLLSHTSYLLLLPGILGYVLVDRSSGPSAIKRISSHLTWSSSFFVVFAFLYFVHFRFMDIGGGPRGSLMEVWINSVGTTFGAKELSEFNLFESAIAVLAAGLVTLIGLVESILLVKEDRPLGALVLVSSVVVPLLVIWVVNPEFLLPRYFLVPNLFLVLAWTSFTKRLWSKMLLGKVLAIAFLVVPAAANLRNIEDLFYYGRGNSAQALTTLVRSIPAGVEPTLTSTSDFRCRLTLQYMSLRIPTLSKLHYLEKQFSCSFNAHRRRARQTSSCFLPQ